MRSIINEKNLKNKKILFNSDLMLINDGWLNNLNYEEFKEINNSSVLKLIDQRAVNFLNTFEENQHFSYIEENTYHQWL